jgi:DNA-binding MarR family transcriptional regulator
MNRKNETLHEKFRMTIALMRSNRMKSKGNYPDTQNRILSLLSLQDGMNQRQLAYLLAIRPQSAGEMLGKLEKSGLIRRETSEEDSRTNLVFLTEEGRRSAEKLAENQEKEDVFDCLSEEEKQQLETLLDKLIASYPADERDERFWKFDGMMPKNMPEEFRRRIQSGFERESGPLKVRPMPFHHGRRHPDCWEDMAVRQSDDEEQEI